MTNFGWESELPALAALSDQEAADAIAAMITSAPVPIQKADLVIWGSNGATDTKPARVIRCRLASELQAPYQSIGYAAQGAAAGSLGLFAGYVDEFHWFEDAQQRFIGYLVAAGVFSQDEFTGDHGLITLHGFETGPKYTGPIYSGQVAEARRAMA